MTQDDYLVALYRQMARETPDLELDRAVLGVARAVAFRRRNRVTLLAAVTGGSLAVIVGLWSSVATKEPQAAPDTAQYGMTAGRDQYYGLTANLSGSANTAQPGMNANPGLTAGIATNMDIKPGGSP